MANVAPSLVINGAASPVGTKGIGGDKFRFRLS